MTLTAIVAERWDDASEALREWAVERIGKGAVTDWDQEDGYVVDCGGGLAVVEVWIGQADDVWYVRTTDDAGGDDDFPDRPYPSREAAAAAVAEFVAERDEAPNLDDLLAQVCDERGWDTATAQRVCEEIASVPEHAGLRLDVFEDGDTSLVTTSVYRYAGGSEEDVPYEGYHGASSLEDAALQLLHGASDEDDDEGHRLA